MGIVADGLAILLGGLFGGKLQKRCDNGNYRILAIGIMIVSLVGFLENVYNVQGENIVSENLIVVLFSFLLGSKLGEKLKLDEKLSNLSKTSNASMNAFIDAALFFGVGGLQLSGPVLLALNGDSGQLYIKSLVDLPFAIAFGATYGKIVSLSAFPVAAVQILIALIAYFCASFFSSEMTAQLCAMGYVILFFSGYNLMAENQQKVNNINMLPGIFLVMIIKSIWDMVEIGS